MEFDIFFLASKTHSAKTFSKRMFIEAMYTFTMSGCSAAMTLLFSPNNDGKRKVLSTLNCYFHQKGHSLFSMVPVVSAEAWARTYAHE